MSLSRWARSRGKRRLPRSNQPRARARRARQVDRACRQGARAPGGGYPRATAVAAAEERARDQRHQVSEETALSVRKRTLETRLGILQVDRDEAVAAAKQEKEISDERARILSEQQRFVLERRGRSSRKKFQAASARSRANPERHRHHRGGEARRGGGVAARRARRRKRDARSAPSPRPRSWSACRLPRAWAREQEELLVQIALVASKWSEAAEIPARWPAARGDEPRDRAHRQGRRARTQRYRAFPRPRAGRTRSRDRARRQDPPA